MDMKWEDHQKWELDWHKENNNCANSYNEETKQYDYANRMGLNEFKISRFGSVGWDFKDNTVLDVGGGPYSLLLKSKAKRMVVLDPCEYPNWTMTRYKECGVEYLKEKAEEMKFDKPFDIVLCYNVLQHVENPEEIVKRMRKYSKLIYFFDWLGIGNTPGHPHILEEEKLNKWLGGIGKIPEDNIHAYYGVFKGDHYV
jgi:2-polyprenyl-3-methyl-5-hydroxy-6-metoxy-1,4-benzoquinol methylase